MIRMQETLQGVLIAEFILINAFAAINLRLAIGAHWVKPSRVTRQTVIVYSFWTIMIAVCIISVLATGQYKWDGNDTVAITVGALGSFAVVAIGWLGYQLSIADPIVRGYLAMVLKSWPQLALAWKIGTDGGAGLPLLALALGHVTILIRMAQLVFSIREAGWDRNRRGSMISEIGNELSWIIVTIVWLFV